MAVVQAFGKANQEKAQLRIEKANTKVQAAQSKMIGEYNAMKMTQSFNRAMSSDVVMAAAQHRKGGSVTAMASAAERQFNWDIDFAKASSEIQQAGLRANLESLDRAANNTLSEGIVNAGISGYNSYQKSKEYKSYTQQKSLLAKKES